MSCQGLECQAERAVGFCTESAQEIQEGREMTVGTSGVGMAGLGRIYSSLGPRGVSPASCWAAPPAASTL